MTTKQLVSIIKKEAQRLRLGDWEFVVGWGSLADTRGNTAVVDIEPEYRKATMTFVPLVDLEAAGKEPHPIRETVIHELLHVLLEGHKKQNTRYDPVFENGLNVLAGLLAGKRRR